MFVSDRLSVLEWLLIFTFLAIPGVNIAFVLWIFIRKESSQSVKNLVIALSIFIVFILIALALWGV